MYKLKSEADPTAGWAQSCPENSDVQYAWTLVKIVLIHWTAKYQKALSNFESISHDNAFLSYHPYEFNQRTLFARFQMNLTQPPHVQFIQKPVYAALGMLNYLGKYANQLVTLQNASYIVTQDQQSNSLFISVIVMSAEANEKLIDAVNLTIKTQKINGIYFVEYLEQKQTDPAHIWKIHGSPAYPSEMIRAEMRLHQVI